MCWAKPKLQVWHFRTFTVQGLPYVFSAYSAGYLWIHFSHSAPSLGSRAHSIFSLTPALIWPLTTYIRNPSLGRDPFPCTISCSFFVHPDSPSPPQAPQSWLQAQGGQVFHSSHPPTTMPNVLANTTICKSLNTILSCYSTRAVCPPHTELHYFISVAPAQGSLRSNRGQNS